MVDRPIGIHNRRSRAVRPDLHPAYPKIGLLAMGTTSFLTREPFGAGTIFPASNAIVSPSSSSLADLLIGAGTAIESLPPGRIDHLADRIAALTAHLIDGAAEAGVRAGEFTPGRGTPAVLSLRALGRLAARTAGTDVVVDEARARRIAELTRELTAPLQP